MIIAFNFGSAMRRTSPKASGDVNRALFVLSQSADKVSVVLAVS
jgi:hypothetical protein